MNRQQTVYLTKPNGSIESLALHNGDSLTRVDGGIEVQLASSPTVTTFYPYHRVHEIITVRL